MDDLKSRLDAKKKKKAPAVTFAIGDNVADAKLKAKKKRGEVKQRLKDFAKGKNNYSRMGARKKASKGSK